MTKRIQAKNKICRRLGVNLWGRAKDPLARRDYGPGEHGQKRHKKSDYGNQLAAKQKLKGYYFNMTEKQFRRAYDTASALRGDTAENLIGLLERRLDIALFRMNFVPTLPAARQFINHGHVRVNGQRVNIASYQLVEGDEIEVSEKAHHMPLLLEAVQNKERDVPEYLSVDFDKYRGKFVRIPKMADVPFPVRMEPNLVVEFYSR